MTTSGPHRGFEDCTQEGFPGSDRQTDSTVGVCNGALDQISRQMLSRLSDTIEGEIIPRLMLALDSASAPEHHASDIDLRLMGSVDEFIRLLLSHDATVAARYVASLRSDGIPLSALYLDLLTPAARRLGVMWEQDECSFTDVTIGVCRMHQVLLEFSRCFDAGQGLPDQGNNVLIVPVPGEQHTFGLVMVIEFVRRAGFNCYTGTPGSRREFYRLTREHDFDVIGLSVSEDRHVECASELIGHIKEKSHDTTVLVGGRAFLDDPSLAGRIGADGTAADGRGAVSEIRRFCPQARNNPGS